VLKKSLIIRSLCMALSWITVGCVHPIEWDGDTWDDKTEEEGTRRGSTGTGEESTKDEEIIALCREILNVPDGADQDTIKKAYRKISRKYHPDKNPGDENATKIFQGISRANEILQGDRISLIGDGARSATIRHIREGLDLKKAREREERGGREEGVVGVEQGAEDAVEEEGTAEEVASEADEIGEID